MTTPIRLLGVFLFLAGCGDVMPSGTSHAALNGGLADAHPDTAAAHAAIVRINVGPSSRCTATLVSPTLLLTAAHCAVGGW